MTRLFNLVVAGAALDDLQFLARMPQLRTLELRGMRRFSMRGIADKPLARIVLADVADVRDLDDLNTVLPGAPVALPHDLWKSVHRADSPFVREYFPERPRAE